MLFKNKQSSTDFDVDESLLYGEINSYPLIQWMHPYEDNDWGIGITQANAESVNFTADSAWTLKEIEFASGEKELMFISHRPNLLILHTGDLMMQEKSNDLDIQQTLPIIPFNKVLFKANSGQYITRQRYVLAPMTMPDGKNAVLPEKPLRISLKNVSAASFGSAFHSTNTKVLSFKKAMMLAHPKSFSSDYFLAHCLFCPVLEKEVRGKAPNTKKCTIVKSFAVPSKETYNNFIVPKGVLRDQLHKLIKDSENWDINFESSSLPQPSQVETQNNFGMVGANYSAQNFVQQTEDIVDAAAGIF